MALMPEATTLRNDRVVIAEEDYLDQLRILWRKNWPAQLRDNPQDPMPGLDLPQRVAEWASLKPAQTAIWFYGKTYSYADLFELSERFANRLLQEGIVSGDRVALFMPNCPQFTIAFLAILRIGAVHCPMSPLAKRDELEHQLKDCGARAIIALQSLIPIVEACKNTQLSVYFRTRITDALPEKAELPLPAMVVAEERSAGAAIDFFEAIAQTEPLGDGGERRFVDLDKTASINYTSGTTSHPKGCLHSQRHMLYTAGANHLRDESFREATLNFFPQFWIAGQNHGLVYQLFSGTTLVLLTRWDPLAFMKAVEDQRIGATTMLVDNLLEVMNHPQFGTFDLSCLKLIRCVSFVKKLGVDIRHRWMARYPHAVLSESAWGMTETHTANTVTIGFQDADFDLKSRPTFVGIPSPGTDFKICDFQTGQILPLGEEGEICCRSSAIFDGYLNSPDATRETLRNGWVHSGDIGQIDEEGFIHYLGRKKDLIKVNGMSVAPAEIEAVLAKHRSVFAVAVVPRPDEERGECPVAFVQLKQTEESTEVSNLIMWCKEQIATYKVPEVRLVPLLPISTTGKIQKEILKRWASSME